MVNPQLVHNPTPPNRTKNVRFYPSVSSGKEKDAETGYGHFGARYMDHELMTMWLSVDPMADKYPAINPYAYCSWNPVKLVDPNGRETIETDIVNKKTGTCKHIEDGKDQIVLLSDHAYNTIERMGHDSYSSMSKSQQERYNSLLNSGEVVSLDSKLGKTFRAVYAEMGNINCTEQDRNVVAASIATRLKTEPNIDKVLDPKQYNATGKEIYKIGPYERQKQISQKYPCFYKKYSESIEQSRLQAISSSYKALNGLLPPEYNNIHSFVSPPLSSTYFDSNKKLSNATSSFSNLKGVSGVWRLK
ncbi:MAG: RHS repeat-associated core domain-containing protein [Bacteroidales bacterium]|nr:RHS repeat-associated core domain-containing protein [Bacteroidales bacterium]